MEWAFIAPVLFGGVLAGASCSLLGVYIVGMRIPFLGICIAHAALAGAIYGSLAGLTGIMLLAPALGGALVVALLLGRRIRPQSRSDLNVTMSILFTLTMGLAFLGLGLFDRFGRSQGEALGLLWGSIAFLDFADVRLIAILMAVQVAFLLALHKQMRAILFSREHAAAAGVPVGLVWTGFLLLTARVLTVNFQTVGGLMIYSLLTNPAAAAFLLVRGYGRAMLLASLLGAACGAGGFAAGWFFDVPPGASIVIFSSLVVAAAATVHRLREALARPRA
jgi:manganese/iron transport system permease protein